MPVPRRVSTRDLLVRELCQGGVIAELGVFLGEFSEVLLRECHPLELHLVDPWQGGGYRSGDKDGRALIQVDDMERVYDFLERRFRGSPIVRLHRRTSVDALQSFADDYFDLVYLDSDHGHDVTTRELELAMKKVKPSGWITGHDYHPSYGVLPAVDEFCERHGLTIDYLTDDGCPTFAIRNRRAEPSAGTNVSPPALDEAPSTANRRASIGRTKRELWVHGYIHSQGGAGTELLHQIELWQIHGVEVHLCVNPGTDVLTDESDPRRRWCDARGIHTEEVRPGLFKDKILVCFCQPDFMQQLPRIVADGKPRLVIWFNCMTWSLFPEEAGHNQDGLIDVFGYQSHYQRDILVREITAKSGRPVRELRGYLPYYHLQNALHAPKFSYHAPTERFVVGRLSRDDETKFPANLWHFFSRITAPLPTEFFVVGYGPNARTKCGDPNADSFAKIVNRVWWGFTADSKKVMVEFWPRIHLLLHKWDNFKENYPRAVIEAMAAGIPVIADRDGGTAEIIHDGETGYLVDSQDEAVYRASHLAWNERERRIIAYAANLWLKENTANPDRAWQCWEDVFAGEYDR